MSLRGNGVLHCSAYANITAVLLLFLLGSGHMLPRRILPQSEPFLLGDLYWRGALGIGLGVGTEGVVLKVWPVLGGLEFWGRSVLWGVGAWVGDCSGRGDNYWLYSVQWPRYYTLLSLTFSALHTPGICILCVTHSWPLHSVHYTLLASAFYALHTPETCTLCITHSWPLHYALLWSLFCMLYTPDPCSLCIMHSWHLYSVYYVLLTPAISELDIPGPCILCFQHAWSLHSLCYALLTPALCAFPAPDPCTLCIIHFWALKTLH